MLLKVCVCVWWERHKGFPKLRFVVCVCQGGEERLYIQSVALLPAWWWYSYTFLLACLSACKLACLPVFLTAYPCLFCISACVSVCLVKFSFSPPCLLLAFLFSCLTLCLLVCLSVHLLVSLPACLPALPATHSPKTLSSRHTFTQSSINIETFLRQLPTRRRLFSEAFPITAVVGGLSRCLYELWSPFFLSQPH